MRIPISAYLAFKEIWRNRARFLLVSLVIALITLLVLFIAALGEGLGNGNKEFIAKLDGELIAYQAKSEFLIAASRLDAGRALEIRGVEGVADAGMIGTSRASLSLGEGDASLNVALLGVEPGHVGEPPTVSGRGFSANDADELIIDRNTALRAGIAVGEKITVRATQGTDDAFFELPVVGISDGRQYGLQPSVFAPFSTWNRIRPQSAAELSFAQETANVIAVRIVDGADAKAVRGAIEAQVEKVEVATLDEAIQALPGYSAQQSTLSTQGGFTLFIGILVIGGFFQIQILQKVGQIGVLKAIGASNPIVAWASVFQITVITVIGVALGSLLTYGFSLFFPPTVPIVFNGATSAIAITSLLLIGPVGGLVSIRYAVRIEPLKALGLQ